MLAGQIFPKVYRAGANPCLDGVYVEFEDEVGKPILKNICGVDENLTQTVNFNGIVEQFKLSTQDLLNRGMPFEKLGSQLSDFLEIKNSICNNNELCLLKNYTNGIKMQAGWGVGIDGAHTFGNYTTDEEFDLFSTEFGLFLDEKTSTQSGSAPQIHEQTETVQVVERNGPIRVNCRMGGCTWIEILDDRTIDKSNFGQNYEIKSVSARSGSSGPHNDGYPSTPDEANVEWGEEFRALVFCSLNFPAADFDPMNDEELETLGVRSPFGYETSSVNFYFNICHGIEPFPNEEQVLRLGYDTDVRKKFSNTTQWKNLIQARVLQNGQVDLDSKVAASLFKEAFSMLNVQNRKEIQSGLKSLGAYNSSIDGAWGRNTEAGVVALFNYLNEFHDHRDYAYLYGFTDGTLDAEELIQFWNDTLSCDTGSLLSKTPVCN